MWVIIAIVLLVIMSGVKIHYGLNDREYSLEIKARENEHEAFIKKYVDESLEERIQDYIKNEENFTAVKEEVNKALAEMPHWAANKIRFYPEVYNDKELIMHIMLANRGKISDWSASFGILTPWKGSGKDIDRFKSYELVEWMKNTLAKQGVYVTPVLIGRLRGHSTYHWKGTRDEISSRYKKERGEYHEFSPALLPRTVNTIPPAYYSNTPSPQVSKSVDISVYTILPPPLPDNPVPKDAEIVMPNSNIGLQKKIFTDCLLGNKDIRAIREEVMPVLDSLPHWKGITVRILDASGPERFDGKMAEIELIEDILLANRGEVRSHSMSFGYKADFLVSDSQEATRQYELLEWIQNTLNKKGVRAELICVLPMDGDYIFYPVCYWKGTHNARVVKRSKEFTKDVLYKQ